MVKAAVRFQIQKMGGIVAFTTFSIGYCMKYRFTDRQVTIVTFTAITKNFLMINIGGNGNFSIHKNLRVGG